MNNRGHEISVKNAAIQIDCTERTILNFIKMKRFRAVKVGRDWFIDYASFISFTKKYDYSLKDDQPPPSAPIAQESPTAKAPAEERVATKKAAPPAEMGYSGQPRRPSQNVQSLRIFEMSRQILSSGRFAEPLKTRKEHRALSLGEKALEEIGAGFYAYGYDIKRVHYSRARARLGAMLALLRSAQSLSESWHKEVPLSQG